MKRLELVDTIKGLAIILVVFGHALALGYGTPGASYSFRQCTDIIYGFHMSIFFIVAGLFVKKWTTLDFKTSLRKKFCRLMIPYFTWGFFLSIYKQLGQHHTMVVEGFSSFLSSPWKPWNIFWFVYLLFFIHLLYYAVVHLCKNYEKGRKLFLIISMVAYILGGFSPHFWITYSLCKFMLFFAIGTYLLAVLQQHNRPRLFLYLLSLGLFTGVNWFYLNLIHQGNQIIIYFYKLITAWSGCLLIWCFSYFILRFCKRFNDMISFLGKKSLEIYVFHPFIIGMGKVILKKCFGIDYLWGQVIFLAVFALIISASVWKYVDEKNKLYRIMFGV